MDTEIPDRLMTIKEVAERLALSVSAIEKWVAQGLFPAPIRLNGKAKRFRPAAARQWLRKQPPVR